MKTKRWLAAVAALALSAMALHGLAHALPLDGDACAACTLGAARAAAPGNPAVVRAPVSALVVEPLPAPSVRCANAPLPNARPPPRG